MSWDAQKLLLVVSSATFFLLCVLLVQGGHGSSDGEKRLSRTVYCPDHVISWAHRYRALGARSVLECVSYCRPDDLCLSVVFDSGDKMCYLGNDVSRPDCSNMVPDNHSLKFYETVIVCDKYGETVGPGGECVCAEGFRGNPCTPYIGDCTEGREKGNFSSNGVYMIHPLLSPDPFSVYCKVSTNNVRTYIMERRNNILDFNRNFSQYQEGFGDLSNNHFLGLDKVHFLTYSKTYELRVSVRLPNKTNFFMQYQIFNVSDVATGYQMSANQTSNDTYVLGDCFAPLHQTRFSAFDNDNDEDGTVNCAAKHGGGWWFQGSQCSICNPTGPLLPTSDGIRVGIDAEAFWPLRSGLGELAPDKISMYFVVL